MIRALPDLLSNRMFGGVVSRLKSDLHNSAMEAATGERRDVTKAARGQTGQVHAAKRAYGAVEAAATRIALISGRYTAAGAALKGVREAVGDFGVEALSAAVSGEPTALGTNADQARSTLRAVMTALGTRFDGRSLFAGAAAGAPALADAGALLSETQALVAAAPSTADARAVLDAYFAPGGGFDAIYTGADADAAAVTLPNGHTLDTLPRADADGFRALMHGLVVIATADRVPGTEAADWTREGTALIRSGLDAVTGAEARVGLALNRLSEAQEGQADARDLAGETLDRIVGRDAYEAASETQALEVRLEAAYTLTARLGRLSLTNFLR